MLRRENALLRDENELLKKAAIYFREGVEVRYAFIDIQRGSHAVRTLCRTLGVSASGYYSSRSRSPSTRAQRQSSLTTRIRKVHMASRQTYGAPRIHAELSAQGIACCRNTVAKLMR